MEAPAALQEFLEFVIGNLVARPELARVVHEVDGDRHVYLIRLAPEDMGRIIGRQGHTIGAIRNLFDAAAEKHGVRAVLKVDEG